MDFLIKEENRYGVRGTRYAVQGAWFDVRGTRKWVPGAGYAVRGTRYAGRVERYEDLGTRYGILRVSTSDTGFYVT